MTSTEPSFTVSTADRKIINQIAARAFTMAAEAGVRIGTIDLQMYVTACHANGCPLRLEALLDADDFNFAHDVFGIVRHMDQSTGKLTRCFLPRFHGAGAERAA